MGNKHKIEPGQQLISDKDFEQAIIHKHYVIVMQNNMRLRPPGTVTGFNDDSVRLADNAVILRNANRFYTQSDES